jgi:hypothetical protein
MARQENACWRCGAKWALPRTALRVVAGGQRVRPAADAARADARLDADRWMNDWESAWRSWREELEQSEGPIGIVPNARDGGVPERLESTG